MSQTNKDYFTEMVKLLVVYGVLAIISIAVIMWLVSMVSGEKKLDSVQSWAISERLKPIERVAIVGDDAKSKGSTEVVAKAAPVALDGKTIVSSTCFACHGTGILESPKTGDTEAWQKRLDANGGIDGLVQSAIKGKGAMPPKGGATVSDAELKLAVEYMINPN